MSLFVWGRNSGGALGVGNAEEKAIFSPTPLDDLENVAILKASAGAGHTAVLTEFGDVYTWGRNKEGQCGVADNNERRTVSRPRNQAALEDELIVDVACGAYNTLAVSAGGKLYQWGLLHFNPDEADEAGEADVEQKDAGVDEDDDSSEGDGEGDGAEGVLPGLAQDMAGNTFLQRVIRDSTLRYLTGGKQLLGGVARMKTNRRICPTPSPCRELFGYHVVSASGGYGHSAILTSEGLVFTCGYNDSGQLGLGHRLNTPTFQLVEKLAHWRVKKIACGQAHNIALIEFPDQEAVAAERARGIPLAPHVFVWGSSALGQLGLGNRRTKLYPAPLIVDANEVVDVACGNNHTVAVTHAGHVYSWGHSEYGQHGGGVHGGHDLQDAKVYYKPVLVQALADHRIVSVTCGAQFTVAVDEQGAVLSWGWNSFGVLGHGKGYFSQLPTPIGALDSYKALSIVAGHNHCTAVIQPSGALYARRFRQFLANPDLSDVQFVMGDTQRSVHGHLAIIAARCPYLAGYVRAAMSEQGVAGASISGSESFRIPVDANVRMDVFLALLRYLYTDRVECPPHRVAALGQLANAYGLCRLASLCRQRVVDPRTVVPDSSFEADMQSMVNARLFSDTTFVVDGQEIYAHRVLLCHALYFQTLLSGHFREASEASIVIDHISAEVFLDVLRWTYTGSRSLVAGKDPNDIMELLASGERFGLTELVKVCERELSSYVTDVDNAEACLDFATQFHMPRLAKQSSDLIESASPRSVNTMDSNGVAVEA